MASVSHRPTFQDNYKLKELKYPSFPNHTNPQATEMNKLSYRNMTFKLCTDLERKMSWLMLFHDKVKTIHPYSASIIISHPTASSRSPTIFWVHKMPESSSSMQRQSIEPKPFLHNPRVIIFSPPNFVPAANSFHYHIMHEFHVSPSDGHFSIKPTLKRIAPSFYWPKWTRDIHRFVQDCSTCQENKYMPTKI